MKIFIGVLIFISLIFTSCPIETDINDSIFWFSEIYSALIDRIGEINTSDYEGDEGVNYQYVVDAINSKWGAGTVTLEPETETETADAAYLLKMIDKANNNGTAFGSSNYATRQVLDAQFVNSTIDRLWITTNKFVAVGYRVNITPTGYIAYSTDGLEWIQLTLGSNRWSDIGYGNGRWITVGGPYGDIAFSTDGIKWTQLTVGSTEWLGIGYGNSNRWVAVGYNGTMANTTNGGTSWTRRTVGADNVNFNNNWNNVAFGIVNGERRWVVVGNNNRMAYSNNENGTSWTQITVGSGNNNWMDVAYNNDNITGNARWVAASNNGKIAHSTDGIEWSVTTININYCWSSVNYGNGEWVVIGYNRSGSGLFSYTAKSTDGIEWSVTSMPTSQWSDAIYGNKWVTVGGYSGYMAHSTNSIDWTQIKAGSVTWTGVAYRRN